MLGLGRFGVCKFTCMSFPVQSNTIVNQLLKKLLLRKLVFYHTFLTKNFPSFGVVFIELLNCLYERFVELTLYLQHQICNSPYCQPYNSYNGNSENLVFDQLIIPKLTFFFILITYLVDIVFVL